MKKNILLVTDNLEYRAIMEKYLSWSFDVKIYISAEKTLSVLEEGINPDLITTGHIVNPFSLTDLESRIKSLLNIAD
jgi:hypothetical protein